MGQGHAGFYSYEWIEDLLGLNIRNSERILPELQNLEVGDVLPLAADGTGIPVAIMEPGRALVLRGRVDAQTKGDMALEDKDAYYETSWAFVLQPTESHSTRLIERFRMDWGPDTLGNTVYYRAILEPGAALSWSGRCFWVLRSEWSPAARDESHCGKSEPSRPRVVHLYSVGDAVDNGPLRGEPQPPAAPD
jgi:hypothetical protein